MIRGRSAGTFRFVHRFLLLALIFVPAVAPADAPSPLDELLRTYSEHAKFPLPDINGAAGDRLDGGKLLKVRDVPDDPELPIRVVGLMVTDEPRAELWIANRDPHYSVVDGAIEVLLTPRGEWPQVWYQHLDAPRPFSDRHWTINVGDSHGLVDATGQRCWEHWWELRPGGLELAQKAVAEGKVPGMTPERMSEAIYTPFNQGAWLVCSLDDGRTLLGYHTQFTAGGRIPEWAIVDYGMATLGRMMRAVETNSREVGEHYRVPHFLIEGGDGRELPLY